MKTYATVEHDFAFGVVHLRVARHYGGDEVHALTPDGDWAVLEPGRATDPCLTVGIHDLPAIRDALNGFLPPSDDTDLREALQVERARVDRILDRSLTD